MGKLAILIPEMKRSLKPQTPLDVNQTSHGTKSKHIMAVPKNTPGQ